MSNKINARVISFYLPQFHPIPENDIWWGKGFTEWTNVGKARPLFRNHYQPRIPADLGYYDLRLPEIREAQANMAKDAGVEGFCYWHYWFDGKRLLERPFNEVLKSGKPGFPFCLAWANETWSGIWHGQPNKILIEQTYPGVNDYIRHFNEILPAFQDKRYIQVNGKPLFYIYRPLNIPDNNVFINLWQDLALKSGLKGIHFVGQAFDEKQAKTILDYGYDAVNSNWQKDVMIERYIAKSLWNKVSEKAFKSKFQSNIWDYKKFANKMTSEFDRNDQFYPTILSGWDNSPRSGNKGKIFINYNPETFRMHVQDVLSKIEHKNEEIRITFLKSWNEWAEGNYVEPDLKYGWGYLNVLNDSIIKNV